MSTIINVALNGMSLNDCVKTTKARFATMDKSIFNIALLCAYGTGTVIPAYGDKGEASLDKPASQRDFCALIDRNKATVSRYIKAINAIIDNNYFADFASGVLPFSFDKVIFVLVDHKELLDTYALSDLLKMSLSTLDGLVAKPDNNNGGDGEEVQFTYNGKTYTAKKSLVEALVAKSKMA